MAEGTEREFALHLTFYPRAQVELRVVLGSGWAKSPEVFTGHVPAY